jgi:tight adherence protein C
MDMPLAIAGLVFASVGTLVFIALALGFSEERRVARALRTVSDWEGEQAAVAEPLLRPFRSRVLGPTVEGFSKLFASLMPDNARERVQHRLDLAGDPAGLTPDGVVGARIAGTVTAALLALLGLALARAGVSLLSATVFGLATAAGFFAPDVWLHELGRRRQDKIRRALPDMLDMLTISVQAGLGFDMALTKLVRNTEGPLAREFSNMLSQVQAGVSRRDALRHLAARTDVTELDNFVVAMVQADIFGVSISGILQAQAAELRTKRRQRAEELAQKAPVQMVFPIILCFLPATLLVILGPAVVAIGRAFGLIVE